MKKILTILDFNRTIYDPETKTFFKNTKSVLKALQKENLTLVLISRKEGDRTEILQENGMDEFFKEIYFVEKKTVELFEELIEKYKPDRTFVVGDYLPAEIRIGNIVGAETIWLARGKFSFLKPKKEFETPKHTVEHLQEILPIIK